MRAGALLPFLAGTLALLAGCAAPGERYATEATRLGFRAVDLTGDPFVHRSWAGPPLGDGDGQTLVVYIEHDGTPFDTPTTVARDPTPRVPLALQLMAQDRRARLLLGRPCYFEIADPRCEARWWTDRRYAAEVVQSMAAALRGVLAREDFTRVEFVGYSGGGTLAWLLAREFPQTTRVITVAANLDVAAWTKARGFSPLGGSLDPATLPPLRPSTTEVHFAGARDAVVPPAVLRSFAATHPAARVIVVDGYDHVCCWVETWAARLREARGTPAP